MSFSATLLTRVVVVGTGLIGRRHASTVKNARRARLVAVVDPFRPSQELLEELSVPWFASVAELLATNLHLDCAIICTPNDSHVSVGLELIAAGIPILVEKPISIAIESGRKLIEAARAADVKILVGHHRRFNPFVVAAKDTLAAGHLGDVTAINGFWMTYKPMQYFLEPTEWRQSAAGGVVLINMIHEVDTLQYLFGPISRVYAEKTISRRGFHAEEGAAITLRFASGIVGTFLLSDNTPAQCNFESGTGENPLIPRSGENFYQIFGTSGMLQVPSMVICSYKQSEKSWHSPMSKTILEVKHAVPFELQLEHFLNVIHRKEEPRCSGEAGLQALIVCEALKRSMKEERPVTVDEIASSA